MELAAGNSIELHLFESEQAAIDACNSLDVQLGYPKNGTTNYVLPEYTKHGWAVVPTGLTIKYWGEPIKIDIFTKD